MPRTDGIYTLPSPPMPLVPETLAKAEDLNLVLQDVATALTGSVATDGSALISGALNMNGQNIIGVNGLTGNNIDVGGAIAAVALYISNSGTIPNLTVSNAGHTGTIEADNIVATSAAFTDLTVSGSVGLPPSATITVPGLIVTGTAQATDLVATSAVFVNLLVTGSASLPGLTELRAEVQDLRDQVSELAAAIAR